MHALYLVSVYLHILAAVVWLGGSAFLALVMVPALRRGELGAQASALFARVGTRFRPIGWICLLLLLATGLFNLGYRGVTLAWLTNIQLWTGDFGRLAATKLVLMLVILSTSAVHDFHIGPRAVELMRTAPGSAEANKLRKTASWIGRSNALFGLVLVGVGVILVRGC